MIKKSMFLIDHFCEKWQNSCNTSTAALSFRHSLRRATCLVATRSHLRKTTHCVVFFHTLVPLRYLREEG